MIFGSFSRQDQLMIESRKIGNLINEARIKTIAGYHLSGESALNFGVHFASDRYVFFSGLTYSPENLKGVRDLLENGVRAGPDGRQRDDAHDGNQHDDQSVLDQALPFLILHLREEFL